MRKNKKLTIKRLEKAIEFWSTLKQHQFNFASYVTKTDHKGCGTVCCLAGWLPDIDPEYYKWFNRSFYSTTRTGKRTHKHESDYFGISDELENHLFLPEEQNHSIFGGEVLFIDTTLEAAINNAKIVLEKLKSGELDDHIAPIYVH